MDYELLIIGGGASGLAAAVTAASYGMSRIVILERFARTGRKILATGNGRCNLSHSPISAKDYAGGYHASSVLKDFGDAANFFHTLGLQCRTDAAGRMYPYSMHAGSVLDVLRYACQHYGVKEVCEAEVTALQPQKHGWQVQAGGKTYTADHVIFAAGGHAAPHLGTDGSAWELLRKLRIPLEPPRPILCPILSDASTLHPLKGLRVKADAKLMEQENCLYQETGEVQFTEKSLSGICVFNMAGLLDPSGTRDYRIVLDLIPEERMETTLSRLFSFREVRCEADCETMLSGILQRPLARHVLKQCHIAAASPCQALNGRQLRQIAETLHQLPFPVKGTADWKQAQATAGGVSAKAMDRSLQVKGYPGLYVVGEAVDVHSICGGYHLHWAWASGCYAAKQIVNRRKQG